MIHEEKYRINFIIFVWIAFLFILILSNFNICRVSGNSMFPTLQDKDYILISKTFGAYSSLYHGEVVVIKNPDDPNYYIKRIIGMPNDRISMKNGLLYINGKKQKESYVCKDSFYEEEFFSNFSEKKIPLDQLFVMGDNRNNSKDSRNGLGYINKSSIVGEMIYRF